MDDNSEVIRDPAIKTEDSWRVIWHGRILTPEFNSKGAAEAHLGLLRLGVVKPDFSVSQDPE
jgi:hypothetical protein